MADATNVSPSRESPGNPMAQAHFCNCVLDRVAVGFNDALQTSLLLPRSTNPDGSAACLPMVSFPIAAQPDKESFGLKGKNKVTVGFESLREGKVFYNIRILDDLAAQDLFFYVFEHTLIGQCRSGSPKGIRIERQRWFKPSRWKLLNILRTS